MRASFTSPDRLLLLALAGACLALAGASSADAAPQDVRLSACTGLLVHGQITLNATNGSEAVAGSQAICALNIKAACANTVDVMVGATGLNYSTSKGRTLAPCASLDVPVEDTADVFLDAGTTASQIVEYVGVLQP